MKQPRWRREPKHRELMKRMIHVVFRNRGLAVLLALLGQGMCLGQSDKPPAADMKALQAEGRFHEIRSVAGLPEPVVALCAGKRDNLADPGQHWQVTDVIMGDKLPAKRLIWAETDGDYYVVHYERGGIAHTFHCLVARLKPGGGKAMAIWRAEGSQLKNFSAFIDAMVHSRLRADLFEKNG